MLVSFTVFDAEARSRAASVVAELSGRVGAA
jgi:hypothetical protein